MTKGQRIRSRRDELKISQTDLAEKIQVSKQTLYKYENDIVTNIPSDKIEALAQALDVTPAYLMGWTDHKDKRITDPVIEVYSNREETYKAISLYAQYLSLPPEKRDSFLNYLKFLKSDS